jgi:hypothetical protein
MEGTLLHGRRDEISPRNSSIVYGRLYDVLGAVVVAVLEPGAQLTEPLAVWDDLPPAH